MFILQIKIDKLLLVNWYITKDTGLYLPFLLSALANYFDSALLTDVQEHLILISLLSSTVLSSANMTLCY